MWLMSVVGCSVGAMNTVRCTIVPPYLLERVAASSSTASGNARRTLVLDQSHRQFRVRREARSPLAAEAPTAAEANATVRRIINDAHHREDLPVTPLRSEGQPPIDDVAANEAYAGLGHTWELLFEAFGRNSLDGKGMPLPASVHYGESYDNAFWDGAQMVFGDGDGKIFNRFTIALDVIGHELAHGVTEHTAGLLYSGESGALNESISDAFGAMVKQRALGQSAAEADWLIGTGLLASGVKGVALRSMIEPGTAYDDPVLGKDPQPASMSGYVKTSQDNGGVHINSGIPNRAFATLARTLAGNSWDEAGQVWYDALTGSGIKADCDFATFARLTVRAAKTRFGKGSAQHQAVQAAWRSVGVEPAVKATASLSLDLTRAEHSAHSRRGSGRGVPR